MYLTPFAIKTITTNFFKSYFKTPATNVIGSPMIGIHESSKEKAPYFSNVFVIKTMLPLENK